MLAALDIETVKKIAIGIAVVLILIAIVVAKLVRSVVTKVVGLLIVGGLLFAVASQRQSLTKCKNDFLKNPQTTCSFFGYQVKLPTPK